MSENTNVYLTTDLYLSAYLVVQGQQFTFEKKSKKVTFSFQLTSGLDNHVNEYLVGSGNTHPLAYANAIKNLKNLLFNR